MNNIVEQVENLVEQNDEMESRIKQLEEQNAKLAEQVNYYTQLNYDLKIDMCKLQDSKIGSTGKVPVSTGAKRESALEKDLKYMESLEASIEKLREINANLTAEKNKQLEANLALQNKVASLTNNLAEAQANLKHLNGIVKSLNKAYESEHKRAEALDAVVKNSSSGRANPGAGFGAGSNTDSTAGSTRVGTTKNIKHGSFAAGPINRYLTERSERFDTGIVDRYLTERPGSCDALELLFELFK